VDVGYHAGRHRRYPRSADLGIGISPEGPKSFKWIDYSPAQHLIPSHVRMGLPHRGQGKGLTSSEEPKVGHPYATCKRYGELVPVPDSNANGAHQSFASEILAYHPKLRRPRTCGAQSRGKRQQRPRTQRAEQYETRYQQTFIPQTGRVGGHAHKLEDALNLGIITCKGADVHMLDSSHDIPDS